ncbi:YceI family protein [Massilia sp. 9096]|uniref:YceI family protein n=1 Tax=Massilia sp. 9096 TaxID=1500894 RepID=UPI00056D5BE3|nr:YceI family protein [Massilia sp. 9096]
MKSTRTALAVLLSGTVLAAAAVPLKTDVAHSSVSATFKQMNVPVESNFKRFNAQVDYDPAHPENASAKVDIDTASFDMGQADYNKEIAKKEWFNSAQFPKASFVSSSIKPAGAGKLAVTGKLTIKGKTQDVSFPLSVKAQGAQQVFEGQLPIHRLAFNVGEGEWKDTGMVADDIIIKFRITAGQ